MGKLLPKIIKATLFLAPFCSTAQNENITGFERANVKTQKQLEKKFDEGLRAENIGDAFKTFSSAPHNIGSAITKEYASLIEDRLKNDGFATRIETFTVLFPTPKIRSLEMTGPTVYKALLKEPALKEDATSSQKGQLP